MCVAHANESNLSTNKRGGDEGWWWAPRKQAVLAARTTDPGASADTFVNRSLWELLSFVRGSWV